jgi:hypothetical protein
MKDLHNNIKTVRAIEPKAIGTTGIANGSLSPAIDLQGYSSCEFVINHGTAGATGDTTSVVIYECDTATGSFTSVADADLLGTEAAAGLPAEATARTSGVGKNITTKVGYVGNKRYVKIRLYGVGHATGIVSANAILGAAASSPVA